MTERTIDDYNRAKEIIGYPDLYDLVFAFSKGFDLHKMIKMFKIAGYEHETYKLLHKRASELIDAAEKHMDECHEDA